MDGDQKTNKINPNDLTSEIFDAIYCKGDIEKIDLGKVDNSRYNQGQRIRTKLMDGKYWIVEKNYIYGLGSVKEGLLSSLVNFQPPAMTSLIDADQ